MFLTDWMTLALVCVIGASLPGPSLAVIFAITRMSGRAAGLMAAFGHGLGILLYAFAAATGLSYLITNHADAFFALQIIGALILLWLGWKLLYASITKKTQHEDLKATQEKSGQSGLISGFTTGFLIAALNPKTAAFFVSVFSQFLSQDQEFTTHIGIALLAGFIDVTVYVIYVLAFTTALLGRWIDRTQHLLERVLGIILLALGFSLIASHLFALL